MNSRKLSLNQFPESLGERIILNVGGVKYETYRSTLTAYPTTLLGIMFQERNKALLHPTNGNEYFIDRDGELFRYILQFYRKNKIMWPEPGSEYFSREELEEEFDYFQIPQTPHSQNDNVLASISPTKTSPIAKLVSNKLDNFILILKQSIVEICTTLSEINVEKFNTIFTITFSQETSISNGITSLNLKPKPMNNHDNLSKTLLKWLSPFGKIGYFLLDKFGEEIGEYLHQIIPEVSWELNHKIYGPRERFYDIILNINYQFDRDIILKNSELYGIFTNKNIDEMNL
ncbi:12491_t:CDS:2 [Funneliformis mosseae]|uniref:12491_t:CDS:1 n=1 Tax=Funneliformis mosseae TaxID=27381 RepID=A0A9N9C0I8_FUNMO|nr:12491_t:CDS:2 [Funneliformis mosseae]